MVMMVMTAVTSLFHSRSKLDQPCHRSNRGHRRNLVPYIVSIEIESVVLAVVGGQRGWSWSTDD